MDYYSQGGYRLGTRLSQDQKDAVKIVRDQAKMLRAQGLLVPARRRNQNVVRANPAERKAILKEIKDYIYTTKATKQAYKQDGITFKPFNIDELNQIKNAVHTAVLLIIRDRYNPAFN